MDPDRYRDMKKSEAKEIPTQPEYYICPEAPETFASMPVCPEIPQEKIAPPDPCDADRTDKPPTLMDMKYLPKQKKVQFQEIAPFSCDDSIENDKNCCCK